MGCSHKRINTVFETTRLSECLVLLFALWLSWWLRSKHNHLEVKRLNKGNVTKMHKCPLLLGGGGPTCRFIAIIWGGGPPQYTMFWKSGPPQCTIIWKKGSPHKHESSKKNTEFTIKGQVPFFWSFFWPIYSVFIVSIKGQGWTPRCTIIWHGDHYKRARPWNWKKKTL